MVIILLPLLIIITFLLLLVIVLFFFTIFDLFLELPYVGAKSEMVSTIIKLAQIKKWETVVDLGSGDGRLLIAAAKRGAKAIGYEINPFLVALTRLKAHFRGYSSSEVEKFKNRGGSPQGRTIKSSIGSVLVIRQSLWKADLAVADVIFVYAKKKTMKKFEDFIFSKAKPGTRVVVNTNPFPNRRPQQTLGKIFLYKI